MLHRNKKLKAEQQEGPSLESALAAKISELRTTCYPQDEGESPPIVGQPKTTTYRQSLMWSRRGYDTIN